MPNQAIILSRTEAQRLLLVLNASNQLLDLLHGGDRSGYSPAASHVKNLLNEATDDTVSISFYPEYATALRLFEWFGHLVRQLKEPGYSAVELRELRNKVTS